MKFIVAKIVLLTIASLVFLSCERELFQGVVEALPTINNKLFIKSNPTNALIYLNKVNTGILTPDTLKWIDKGRYVLTLKHYLFIDTTLVIDIEDKTTTQMEVDHYKNPGHMGKLSCSTNPEKADITINNVSTGKKTPITFSGLLPGYYKVKYDLAMHRSDSTNILVVGGDSRTALIILDDTTTGLWYNTINSKIPTNNTYCVAVDSNNIKWIGTEEFGLVRFDGKTWKVFNKYNLQIPSNVIKILYVDRNNRLWIGMDKGLVVYNGSTFINYSHHVNNLNVSSITQDEIGNIWIGALGGLFKHDGTSWQHFHMENSGLRDNYIFSVEVDKQNTIWVGTLAGGMCLFNGLSWKYWDLKNMGIGEKKGDITVSLASDKNGIMWAAFMRYIGPNETIIYEGGLAYFNGTKWTLAAVPQISTEYVNSIYIDKSNNKWISTKFGLGRFDKNNNAALFSKTNAKLQSNNITGTVLDKNGELYVSTIVGGLSKFRKGYF